MLYLTICLNISLLLATSGGGGGGDGPVARGRVARTQDAEDAVKVVKKPRAARISAPPRHYEDPEALRSNFSKRFVALFFKGIWNIT